MNRWTGLIALVALLAACPQRSPEPEITLSSTGDADTCTLGSPTSAFRPEDQLALRVDLGRPFGTNQVQLGFYRLAENGSRQPLFRQSLRVRPEHESLCVIDERITAGKYVAEARGNISVELTRNDEILASTQFAVPAGDRGSDARAADEGAGSETPGETSEPAGEPPESPENPAEKG